MVAVDALIPTDKRISQGRFDQGRFIWQGVFLFSANILAKFPCYTLVTASRGHSTILFVDPELEYLGRIAWKVWARLELGV